MNSTESSNTLFFILGAFFTLGSVMVYKGVNGLVESNMKDCKHLNVDTVKLYDGTMESIYYVNTCKDCGWEEKHYPPEKRGRPSKCKNSDKRL